MRRFGTLLLGLVDGEQVSHARDLGHTGGHRHAVSGELLGAHLSTVSEDLEPIQRRDDNNIKTVSSLFNFAALPCT